MQLHAWLEAAPALGRGRLNTHIIRMQNHALYACTRSLRQASQKKGWFQENGRKQKNRILVKDAG
jgi:hypothetical protein